MRARLKLERIPLRHRIGFLLCSIHANNLTPHVQLGPEAARWCCFSALAYMKPLGFEDAYCNTELGTVYRPRILSNKVRLARPSHVN